MLEDGDRRHVAVSGGCNDRMSAVTQRNDEVSIELVLLDQPNRRHLDTAAPTPLQDLG